MSKKLIELKKRNRIFEIRGCKIKKALKKFATYCEKCSLTLDFCELCGEDLSAGSDADIIYCIEEIECHICEDCYIKYKKELKIQEEYYGKNI